VAPRRLRDRFALNVSFLFSLSFAVIFWVVPLPRPLSAAVFCVACVWPSPVLAPRSPLPRRSSPLFPFILAVALCSSWPISSPRVGPAMFYSDAILSKKVPLLSPLSVLYSVFDGQGLIRGFRVPWPKSGWLLTSAN